MVFDSTDSILVLDSCKCTGHKTDVEVAVDNYEYDFLLLLIAVEGSMLLGSLWGYEEGVVIGNILQ